MRVLLPLLLWTGCRVEDPLTLEVDFDTEIANVATARTDGSEVRWGLSPEADDGYAWDVPGDHRLVGLPQGATVYVQAATRDLHHPERTSEVLEIEVPQTGLPDLEVLRSESGSAMARGYVAAAILDDTQSGLAIYDGLGRVVWGWQAPAEEVTASPVFSANGDDLLGFFSARNRDVDLALIRRLPLSGEPVTNTLATRGHHTFVERDGDLVWLSRNFPTVDQPPGTSWQVMNDAIRSAPEGSAHGGAEVFDLLDVQPFFWPCTHADAAIDRYGITGVHDWSHANSLVWDEDSRTWIFGVRLHDAIWGLDHDFRPLWSIGGPSPTLAADTDWSHAHFTEAWDGGLLLFDNGAHRDPPASRVVELAIDPAAGTATAVWEFAQPDGGFTSWLGDARRLPNGNRLLAFTEVGRILEVTPEGAVVWEARTPASFVGRIRFTEDLRNLPPG